GSTLTYALGRRGQVSAKGLLTGEAVGFYGTGEGTPAVEVADATAHGGSYVRDSANNSLAWAPRVVSPQVGDALGVYHLLARLRTQDVSATAVNVRIKADEDLDPWYTDVGTAKSVGTYFGPYVQPFAAGNTWTVVDAGQVSIPPFAAGALSDPAQLYVVPRPEIVGSGVTTYEADADWQMLLPVDGSLLLGVVNNPSNSVGAVTGQWLWVYLDGLLLNRAGAGDGPSWSYSLEGSSTPNPGHGGGGPGTQGTGAINVNSAADAALTLDPSLQLSGQVGGVNQIAAVVYDQNAAVLGLYAEVQYSPLYLYPR
ncbi:MAG TPA: hypothetical protein VGN32_02790, partial [Ktedonobacterales bacterium]|nr:hypothetical protein [Ktedonobacterales bacterium]